MSLNKKYSIFVSSTFNDLVEYRKSIHNAILSDGNFPVAMENFTASTQSQWKIIQELIDNCDIYILVVGFKYGSIDEETGMSYTEKEYDYAISANKPILSFILSENFDLEHDGDMSRIKTFRAKVLNNNRLAKICKEEKNLSSDIISALHKEISRTSQRGWVRGNYDTYIGLSLYQINEILESTEKEIIKLFEINNTTTILFHEVRQKLKLSKQKFQYYIEHLGELQLLYYDDSYISDNTNYCELLPDGRKFLIKMLKDNQDDSSK